MLFISLFVMVAGKNKEKTNLKVKVLSGETKIISIYVIEVVSMILGLP